MIHVQTPKSQRGSVFIYILMAIALLGALTYAVSRGSRTNTNALTAEQAKLAAQEIIDYGNTVATAVQKLRLRGCADTEISFEGISTLGFSADYINPNAPSDNSCHVFNINAGGISPNSIDYQIFDGGVEIDGIGNTDNNNESTELIFSTRISSDISEDLGYGSSQAEQICSYINQELNETDTIHLEGDITRVPFKGVYSYQTTADEFSSRLSGCILESANIYTYYQVLIAR